MNLAFVPGQTATSIWEFLDLGVLVSSRHLGPAIMISGIFSLSLSRSKHCSKPASNLPMAIIDTLALGVYGSSVFEVPELRNESTDSTIMSAPSLAS